MAKAIELIARAIIVSKGRLLVTRAKNKSGGYSHAFLPGGHIEWGETAAEALRRELEEEAGIALRVGRALAVEDNFYGEGERRVHEINFVFIADFEGMDAEVPVTPREAHIAFEWVGKERFAEVRLMPAAALRWVEDSLRGRNSGASV